MLNRSRYISSLRLPPHMRPPMCLQYIVMAAAAGVVEAHKNLAMPLYLRARAYAEADEIKVRALYSTNICSRQKVNHQLI
jgi:phytoene/squalene synthetase